jgi:diamine N-acetyltransferase
LTLPPPTLRLATPDDAAPLAAFAEQAFREAFGPDNRAEDMDAYCAIAYALHRQRYELVDPARVTLLAEHDGQLAGYAQLLDGPAPACVLGPAPIELLRFYVGRPWQGRGLARALMAEAIGAAERRQARTLYLGVWERNRRAIAFYTKEGFRDVGSRPFVLGTDEQTDRVMALPLGPSRPR